MFLTNKSLEEMETFQRVVKFLCKLGWSQADASAFVTAVVLCCAPACVPGASIFVAGMIHRLIADQKTLVRVILECMSEDEMLLAERILLVFNAMPTYVKHGLMSSSGIALVDEFLHQVRTCQDSRFESRLEEEKEELEELEEQEELDEQEEKEELEEDEETGHIHFATFSMQMSEEEKSSMTSDLAHAAIELASDLTPTRVCKVLVGLFATFTMGPRVVAEEVAARKFQDFLRDPSQFIDFIMPVLRQTVSHDQARALVHILDCFLMYGLMDVVLYAFMPARTIAVLRAFRCSLSEYAVEQPWIMLDYVEPITLSPEGTRFLFQLLALQCAEEGVEEGVEDEWVVIQSPAPPATGDGKKRTGGMFSSLWK